MELTEKLHKAIDKAEKQFLETAEGEYLNYIFSNVRKTVLEIARQENNLMDLADRLEGEARANFSRRRSRFDTFESIQSSQNVGHAYSLCAKTVRELGLAEPSKTSTSQDAFNPYDDEWMDAHHPYGD